MIIQYILNKILNFKWERGRVMVSYDGPVPPHLKLSSYPSALLLPLLLLLLVLLLLLLFSINCTILFVSVIINLIIFATCVKDRNYCHINLIADEPEITISLL